MTHEELTIDLHTENDGHTLVFKLTGSFDLATSPPVRAALTDAMDKGKQELVVDLSRVEFLDSTGLGALIGAQRRAAESNGSIRLVVNEGPILRLLNITGLIRVLAVYHSLPDALAQRNRVESNL
jgi:anti-sigma B factor antagonist